MGDNGPHPERECGGGQVIGIVEVKWKVCASVVYFRLKRSVILHNALHRFRAGQVMGTTTLEANMSQQIVGIAHKPLFRVFLDIRKSYNSMDRGLCLEVMKWYGMGLNLDRLLKSYWGRNMIVTKICKFLGN